MSLALLRSSAILCAIVLQDIAFRVLQIVNNSQTTELSLNLQLGTCAGAGERVIKGMGYDFPLEGMSENPSLPKGNVCELAKIQAHV